jgi:hypothetical protein
MGTTTLPARRRPTVRPATPSTALPIPTDGIWYSFWPVVRLADGTLRKGPAAEVVGRWR